MVAEPPGEEELVQQERRRRQRPKLQRLPRGAQPAAQLVCQQEGAARHGQRVDEKEGVWNELRLSERQEPRRYRIEDTRVEEGTVVMRLV